MLEGGRLCLPAGSSWRAAIFAGSTQGDRALQELWCRPRARETLRRLCIPRAQLQHRAAPRPWCGRAPPPTMERPPSPAPTAGQGGRGLPGNGKMLFQTKPINRQLGQGWGGTRPGWGCLGSTRGYPSPNSATKIQRGEAVVAAPLRQNLLWSQPLPRTPEHQLRTALGPGMPLPSWGTGQGQGVLLRGWPCWPLPWATLPSEPWPHRTPRMRLSP